MEKVVKEEVQEEVAKQPSEDSIFHAQLRGNYAQLGEIDYHLEVLSQQISQLRAERMELLKKVDDLQQQIQTRKQGE